MRKGLDFREIYRRFAKEFEYQQPYARRRVNKIADDLAAAEDPSSRKRAYAAILQIYHDQIVGSQADMVKIQEAIKEQERQLSERLDLEAESLEPVTKERTKAIEIRLRHLKSASPEAVIRAYDTKSRVRERLQRCINDLVKVRGFGIQTSWRAAVNTLLDDGIMPPASAARVLAVIETMEAELQQLGRDDVRSVVSDAAKKS